MIVMRKNLLIYVITFSVLLLMTTSSFGTVILSDINKSSNNKMTTNIDDADEYDHLIYIGDMAIIYDDEEDNAKMNITIPAEVERVDFTFGEIIRAAASWTIIDGGISKDKGWYFKICSITFPKNEWEYCEIIPLDKNTTFVKIKSKYANLEFDHKKGIPIMGERHGEIYFDFIPQRSWFLEGARHTLLGVDITLECVYRYKTQHSEWNEIKLNDDTNQENWHIEYKNTAPTIESYEYYYKKIPKMAVAISFTATDPDYWTGGTGSQFGDYIGIKIDWGDNKVLDTTYSPYATRDRIVNGVTTISGNYHTYNEDGTYTITAQARDWYNGHPGDWSNVITFEVIVPKSKPSLNQLFQQLCERLPVLQQLLGFY